MIKPEKKIIVAEIFSSIQGEGITTGNPSIFLRLGGCNLMCGGGGTEVDKKLHNGATWRCDTIEVWRKGKAQTVKGLAHQLLDEFRLVEQFMKGWRLIITGGEPLAQGAAIESLFEELQKISFEGDPNCKLNFPWRQIEIETNGTIFDNFGIVFASRGIQFNVSPKLENSGETEERRYKPEILKQIWRFGNVCTFKFVVSEGKDLEEIDEKFRPFIPAQLIYLMPAASNQKDLIAGSFALVPEVMKRGYKFSSRLQVAIWNETTGV